MISLIARGPGRVRGQIERALDSGWLYIHGVGIRNSGHYDISIYVESRKK